MGLGPCFAFSSACHCAEFANGSPVADSHGHAEQLLGTGGQSGTAHAFGRMQVEHRAKQTETFTILPDTLQLLHVRVLRHGCQKAQVQLTRIVYCFRKWILIYRFFERLYTHHKHMRLEAMTLM